MKKKIAAANWKMNLAQKDVTEYFRTFKAALSDAQKAPDCELVFALPNLFLEKAKASADASFHIAAQNVHWADKGAYTGETSLGMLKEAGILWTLIGHSERRQYFAETDEVVAKKVKAALAAGFTVICCVGESLAEREANQTEAVLARQLTAVLAGIDPKTTTLVIAYEPIWAIGTGLAATAAQAGAAHRFIHSVLAKHLSKVPAILYGGSVKAQNAKELFLEEHVDGCLVGGASLDPREFAAIARCL